MHTQAVTLARESLLEVLTLTLPLVLVGTKWAESVRLLAGQQSP